MKDKIKIMVLEKVIHKQKAKKIKNRIVH